MSEGASFKRDVEITLRKATLSLCVAGNIILDGELAHNVRVDQSEWFVDDEIAELEGRYFVVEMSKANPHVDWQAPLLASGEELQTRMVIGGVGDAQKKATMQQ
ncbi:MAG: hypothetical protein SGPRY_007515, partial [Prymnesium sp.]